VAPCAILATINDIETEKLKPPTFKPEHQSRISNAHRDFYDEAGFKDALIDTLDSLADRENPI
jgi:hypothetical protein